MAAMMAQETAETLCRMIAAKVTFAAGRRPSAYRFPALDNANAPSSLGDSMRPVGLAFSLSTSLLLSVAPAIHAQATPAAKPAALKWRLPPARFPPAARLPAATGDRTTAGPVTAQLP